MRTWLLGFGILIWSLGHAATPPGLEDLAGAPVAPLSFAPETKAVMLLFVAPDCPISNRYAPTLARLAGDYATKGIRTWLIYADDQADPVVIRAHQKDYQLDLPTALDRKYLLTKYSGADVTPEAVVYLPGVTADEAPRLVYRGRIDDQYEGFGRYRPAATGSELTQILDQIVAGQTPDPVITKAIGCYIPQ